VLTSQDSDASLHADGLTAAETNGRGLRKISLKQGSE
jgi:hypothetical protein